MVTAFTDDATLAVVIGARCDGIVTKDRAADELVRVLRAVDRGEAAIPPELLQRALPGLRGDGAIGGITRRELEVLGLLAEGLSNAAIGARLHISPNTVRNHVQNLLAKLGASSRLEAVSLGVGRGLVRAGPGV